LMQFFPDIWDECFLSSRYFRLVINTRQKGTLYKKKRLKHEETKNMAYQTS